MLNLDQEIKIENVLWDKIGKGEAFTAFSITKDVRSSGEQVEHHEVREYVHDFMLDEMDFYLDYVKSLELINGSVEAFVYYPDDMEPEDAVSSLNISGNENHIMVDGRGRLCIPASIVRSVDLKIGDKVTCCVRCDNMTLDIVPNKKKMGNCDTFSCSSTYITSYIVDKNSNIRISKSVLKNISDANFYRFFNVKTGPSHNLIEITVF